VIAHGGRVVAGAHSGYAESHHADGSPQFSPTSLRGDEIYDIASLTKIFVAAAALTQVRAGLIGLDDAVAAHLPAFTSADAEPARARVRIRDLLTHTSGLPAVFTGVGQPRDRSERIAAVLGEALHGPPGRRHVYSCVGYQVLGLLLEQRTGTTLPHLLATEVIDPLGLVDTGYRPQDEHRVVPTEYQQDPPRGLVRAQVHDEAAWVLGGAGNAGLFSTAADVLAFAEAIRTLTGPIDLPMQQALYTDQLSTDQRLATGYGQAVGFRVGDASFMGADATGLVGHTGFTGTSMVIDPVRELSVVLLTNRVHPVRSAFTVQGLRRMVVQMAQQWADEGSQA